MKMPLYMWKMLQISLTLLFISPIYLCTFDIVCPNISHKKFRMMYVCNTTLQYYTCLKDANKQQYKELCIKEDELQSEGYKTEIRGGFNGVPCSLNYYQPFIHSTKIGENCALKKTFCNEEGQIVSDVGSSKEDKLCRCDYTVGYNFVISPRRKCFCKPTMEDCSCYMKQCSPNEILTPDYECTSVNRLDGNFFCPDINGLESGVIKKKKRNKTDTATRSFPNKEITRSDGIAILLFLIGVGIGLCTFGAISSCNKNRKHDSSNLCYEMRTQSSSK